MASYQSDKSKFILTRYSIIPDPDTLQDAPDSGCSACSAAGSNKLTKQQLLLMLLIAAGLAWAFWKKK